MSLVYKLPGSLAALVIVALVALAVVISHDSACEPGSGAGGSLNNPMQAIVYHCYGSPDVLQLEEIEKPVPAANELLVKVETASVNPLDWHYMRGSPYIMRLSSGLGAPDISRLGADYAGVVEAVGKSVSQFKPGDEVFGRSTGAFGEYVIAREAGSVTQKPANVSFEQAAAVPIAAITALQALRDKANLQPGQKVLINGASGGVGTFAVQIAKAMGAEVTGVCSDRNAQMVLGIGADHVIDYKRTDFTQGEQRYDVIVDNVGNHPLLAVRRALKPDGVLVMVGGAKGNWLGPLLNPIKAMLLSPFVSQRLELLMALISQQDLAYLAQLMAQGEVTPVIDRVYPLAEVPLAIAYSEEGRARGKIIVTVPTR